MRQLTVIACFGLGLAMAPCAWAQETVAHDLEPRQHAEALIAEIQSWDGRDMRADPEAALEQLLDLVQRVEANGAVPLENHADLITLVGVAHFSGQNYTAAAEWMARSAAIYEQAGGPQDKIAEALNNRAVLLRALKRLDEAEETARRALAIRQDMYGPEHIDVASTLYSLANILFSQGRFEDALPYMREAVRQQRELAPDDHQRLVQRITGLGAVLNDSGRDAEAIKVMREAERLGRELLGPEHQTYATTLHNFGLNLAAVGMHGQAIPILREGLASRERIHGPDHQWTAASLSSLASSLEATGGDAEAAVLHEQALAVFEEKRAVVGSETIARTQSSLAGIAARRQDWDVFEARIGAAREEVDANLPETHPMRINVHLLEAGVLERRGRTAEALAIAERWVPIQVETLIPTHRDRIYGELLLLRLRQAEGAAGADIWPQADAAIERLAEKLTDITSGDRQRVSEADANRRSSLLYLRMALAEGDAERIFLAGQLANITDLSLGQENIAAYGAAPADGPAALRAQLVGAVREETRLAQALGAARDAQNVARAENLVTQLDEAIAARQAAETELRLLHPDYVERSRPTPIALADFAERLDPGESLLLLVEGDARGWVIDVRFGGGLTTREFGTADTDDAVARLREAVEQGPAGDFPLDAAHRLYRAIFGDGDARERVLVFGGRSLASLPFGMLTTAPHEGALADAPWLARRASFQVVGNLNMFGMRSAIRASVAGRGFAGIGGVELPGAAERAPDSTALFRSGRPDLGSIAELPPLPKAAEELRRIAQAIGSEDGLLLVGPDAAEERVKQADLSQVEVIAFATHGLVAGEVTGLWEPALLVGTGDESSGEDGLLGASEIARLKLGADWVILSACNTAAGADRNAPVFSGLATGFAQAGARSLLLSHWRVRDDAAARLSVETVRGTRTGLARAEALRRAQLALIEDPGIENSAHPALWAPFVLIDN